jgi:uncharacterized RDD family membrane protein YckC
MSALDPSAAAPAPVPPGRKVCTGCGTANQATSAYCHKCGLQLPQETVTGPAIRPAGFWVRVTAFIIDQIFLFVVGFVILFVNGDQESANVIDLWAGFATIDIWWDVIVPLAIETVYFTVAIGLWGRTIGKAVMRVKVVRTDGGRVSIGRAFGRYLAYLLNWLTFGIGFLVIAFNPQKRGLHDLIVDTQVVRL